MFVGPLLTTFAILYDIVLYVFGKGPVITKLLLKYEKALFKESKSFRAS